MWQLSHEGDKKGWRDEKTENQRKGATDRYHIMLVLPRSHLHHSQSVHCVAWTHSAHGISTTLLAKGINCSFVEVTSKAIRDKKRALPPRGRDVLVQDVLPTTAQLFDVDVTSDGSLSTRHEKIWHAQTGRSCSSAKRASIMPWNLSAGKYDEVSPRPQARDDNFDTHCCSTLRLASNDNSTVSACRIGVTCSTEFAAEELLIICCWTSQRTLERYVQEGTFLLFQNWLSKTLQTAP